MKAFDLKRQKRQPPGLKLRCSDYSCSWYSNHVSRSIVRPDSCCSNCGSWMQCGEILARSHVTEEHVMGCGCSRIEPIHKRASVDSRFRQDLQSGRSLWGLLLPLNRSRPDFGEHDLNCHISCHRTAPALSCGYVHQHSTSTNHTSEMVEFDTPLSKAAKKLCDAYISLDMNNVEPLMSKNYQYEALPECTDLPKLTKEGHIQAWEGILSSANKVEVRIRYWRTVFKLRLISTTPR